MTSFTYVTYIHATPERVWQGLTDPAVTKRYWRHHKAGAKTFRSDWKKGSTYDLAHEEIGLVVSDPEQVILESDPSRPLAYTWHTITPEWAASVGMNDSRTMAGSATFTRVVSRLTRNAASSSATRIIGLDRIVRA